MPIVVTGAAGFIGAKLVEKLLINDEKVIGIDNINSYYETSLKLDRIKNIEKIKKGTWDFYKESICDNNFLNKLFKKKSPQIVVNLAAQAGVRYSLENPEAYIQSNILGFSNVIECCKKYSVRNFIYASSSSVYGGNQSLPFDENDSVNHPISLYAATKKANELIAHGVNLKGICLKPNMIIDGTLISEKSSSKTIAEKTISCFKEVVPEDVPGIVFLSGGQTEIEATENLDQMNKIGNLPWNLSFSYGRALQASALQAWSGKVENEEIASATFDHRAKMNSLATLGKWESELEK